MDTVSLSEQAGGLRKGLEEDGGVTRRMLSVDGSAIANSALLEWSGMAPLQPGSGRGPAPSPTLEAYEVRIAESRPL